MAMSESLSRDGSENQRAEIETAVSTYLGWKAMALLIVLSWA